MQLHSFLISAPDGVSGYSCFAHSRGAWEGPRDGLEA